MIFIGTSTTIVFGELACLEYLMIALSSLGVKSFREKERGERQRVLMCIMFRV